MATEFALPRALSRRRKPPDGNVLWVMLVRFDMVNLAAQVLLRAQHHPFTLLVLVIVARGWWMTEQMLKIMRQHRRDALPPPRKVEWAMLIIGTVFIALGWLAVY